MPRPTSLNNDSCCDNSSNLTPITDFVFIGDTSENTASAYKFYRNNLKNIKNGIYKLYVLFQGQDLISGNDRVFNIDFPNLNIKIFKSYFKAYRTFYISKGDQMNGNTTNQYLSTAQFLKIPRGPLGDFNTLPNIPEISFCYINNTTHRNIITSFLAQNVIPVNFNTVETNVLNNMKNYSSLGKINLCQQILGPSLPLQHLFFADPPCSGTQLTRRNLLQTYYFKLLDAAARYPNYVSLFYNTSKLQFVKSTVGCGWDTSFNTPGILNTNPASITISNASPIFRTDPFTYTKLITKGMIGCGTDNSRQPVSVKIPTQYKSCISAPISIITDSQGNVMPARKDLVTTSFTFSCGDTSMNTSSTFGATVFPTFCGYVYTTVEDIKTGLYAAPGYTLLCTEGNFNIQRACRTCFYDIRTKSNYVLFADNKYELYVKRVMERIQILIYESYGLNSSQYPTFATPTIELTNTTYGLKQDNEWYTFTPKYFTMPSIMLGLLNSLYSQDSNVSNMSNMPCCNDSSYCNC